MSSNPRGQRRVLIIWVGAVAVIALGVGLLFLWSQPEPDFATPPEPNAYELLVEAAGSLVGRDPSEVTNKFEQFVAKNQAAFDQVQEALRHRSELPPEFYDSANSSSMTDMMALKRLGLAVMNRAKLAEQKGRWKDAAVAYIDTIRMGQKVETGPMFQLLVGTAIELAGLQGLERLTESLEAEELAKTAGVLRELNTERIPLSEVIRRERYFVQVNASFLEQLKALISGSTERIKANVQERYLSTAAYVEIVATGMDARRFAMEKGRAPQSLDDLTPEYATTVPLDPYTDTGLFLRQTADQAVLIYSAGPNRQDDGGQKDDVTGEYQDDVGYRVVTEAISNL